MNEWITTTDINVRVVGTPDEKRYLVWDKRQLKAAMLSSDGLTVLVNDEPVTADYDALFDLIDQLSVLDVGEEVTMEADFWKPEDTFSDAVNYQDGPCGDH